MVESHGDYLLKKLTVQADGKAIDGKVVTATVLAGSGAAGVVDGDLSPRISAEPRRLRWVGIWQDFCGSIRTWMPLRLW